MKALFQIITDQDVEQKNFIVVINIKDNMRRANSTEKEFMSGNQDRVLKVVLLKESNKVKASGGQTLGKYLLVLM